MLPGNRLQQIDQVVAALLVVRQELETGQSGSRIAFGVRPRVLTAQEPAGEWTPHHYTDARIRAERHELVLEIAADKRVVNLRCSELAPAMSALHADCLRGEPGRPIRKADVAYLAVAHQILERFDRLLDRGQHVDLVHQVDIDVVGAKTREASVHGCENVPARETRLDNGRTHAISDFGRDHHLLAASADRLAEYSLGFTASVDIRRVEEIDAAIDRARHDFIGSRLVQLESGGKRALFDRSEGHAAEGQTRHDESRVA